MKFGIFLVNHEVHKDGIKVCETKKPKIFFSINRAVKHIEKMAGGKKCWRGRCIYAVIYNMTEIGTFECYTIECPWWFDLIGMGLA